MEVALKVDVDTHQGLGEGVPRLMRVLADLDVTATFLVAMGPDNAGRAIVRVLKNPGFLKKMRRTRAVSMYGLRTVLSGTVLPARPIALAILILCFALGASGQVRGLIQDSAGAPVAGAQVVAHNTARNSGDNLDQR